MYKLISNLGDVFYIKNKETLEMLLSEGGRLMIESEIIKHETHPSTNYHVWDNELLEWVDSRTPEQLAEYNRAQIPTLTPIEFDIKLVDAGLYDQVQGLIQSDIKLKIAYTRATFFSRTDPFIDQARIALGLTDEQVDTIWVQQNKINNYNNKRLKQNARELT